nr:hypothetical protein [Tanacetum cinerariifolium]
MEEMLAKFIDEGKRKHEEMEIFIKEFRTTNELLLKERNNLLSGLKIKVNELSEVMGNVLIPKNKVKGVKNKGGKMTYEATPSKEINETRKNKNEPPRFKQDVQEKPHDVGMKNNLRVFWKELVNHWFDALTRMSLELADRSIQYPMGIVKNVLIKATARAMIDVFNKKITLRVGDDEVIFDIDQSIKMPPTKNDECYGIDDLDDTINMETHELLENDQLIRPRELVKNEHLYSASANEIDETKPELKDLPSYLEYEYLHGHKSVLVIFSSRLSEEEKISLLQELKKRKGEIAWRMSDIKGISPSFCTHEILIEDDFKSVIQPQRHLNLKV